MSDGIEDRLSGEARLKFATGTVREEMHKLIRSKGKSKQANRGLMKQVNDRLEFIESLAGNLNR